MGLMDRLAGFLTGADQSAYGILQLPGRVELELPAATLQLFYCEWGQGSERERFRAPDDLHVAVTPVGGEPLTIDRGMPVSGEQPTQEGVYRFARLGKVVLHAPGRYVVEGSVADRHGPHLRIGR